MHFSVGRNKKKYTILFGNESTALNRCKDIVIENVYLTHDDKDTPYDETTNRVAAAYDSHFSLSKKGEFKGSDSVHVYENSNYVTDERGNYVRDAKGNPVLKDTELRVSHSASVKDAWTKFQQLKVVIDK